MCCLRQVHKPSVLHQRKSKSKPRTRARRHGVRAGEGVIMITDAQVIDAIAEFYKSGTGNGGMREALEAYEQSKWTPMSVMPKKLLFQTVYLSNGVFAYFNEDGWIFPRLYKNLHPATHWKLIREFKEQ